MKDTVEFDGIVPASEYAKSAEKMSLLEQVIFGHLVEGKKGNQRAYSDFLVSEFNSHIDEFNSFWGESDNGKRREGDAQFIERYFPQLHTKKRGLRIGRKQSKALSEKAGSCVKVTVMEPRLKLGPVTGVAEKKERKGLIQCAVLCK